MKNKLKELISLYLEDIFIFIGLIIVLFTTYRINTVVSNYLLGAIFILTGLIISKSPPKN